MKEPKAVQPISAVVPEFNKAIADQSCAEFTHLNFSQTRQITVPGARPVGSECKVFKLAQLPNLRGLSFNKSAAYGTAALMEGPPPKKLPPGAPAGVVAQALFILDRDGNYRYVLSNVDRTQIGVKPSSGAVDGGKNARAVIAAVRTKDCATLVPLIHPAAVQLTHTASKQGECKALVNGKLFAPSLRATKNPKPALLGQTRDFAFYGVATKRSYFTLVMATPPGTSEKPPIFVDVLLNTSNPALPRLQP